MNELYARLVLFVNEALRSIRPHFVAKTVGTVNGLTLGRAGHGYTDPPQRALRDGLLQAAARGRVCGSGVLG